MRYIIHLIFGLSLIHNVSVQHDTVYFSYDKKDYFEVAKNYLQKLYEQEKTSKIPVFASKPITDRYSLQDLNIISIPVFYLKNEIYACGDNLETSLSLIRDPFFQVVMLTAEDHSKVGRIEIFDSFYEKNRLKDSIDKVSILLHGRPVYFDSEKMEKNLISFINTNPNVLVFMIKGFNGYWAIKQGKICKLTNGTFGIRAENGSQYICQNYGQEYINDIIQDEFRTGRAYKKCLSCETFNKRPVTIKLE